MQIETKYDLNSSLGYHDPNNDSLAVFMNRADFDQGRVIAIIVTEGGIIYRMLNNKTLAISDVPENEIPDSLVAEVVQSLENPVFPELTPVEDPLKFTYTDAPVAQPDRA